MIGALACEAAYGVGIAVAAVFAALSALHVYWALGGTVGVAGAIPERPAARGDADDTRTPVKVFHPPAAMTLLVAGALAAVSALVSLRAGLFGSVRTDWLLRGSLAGVAVILIARAVGDLNLVGFFKKLKGTRFAILDTWLYSPLCTVLALGMASLALSTDCQS
jgi:hypothetical protein